MTAQFYKTVLKIKRTFSEKFEIFIERPGEKSPNAKVVDFFDS